MRAFRTLRAVFLSLNHLACVITVNAQECGTDQLHRYRKAHDSMYAHDRLQAEQDYATIAQSHNGARFINNGTDTTFEIPLVLHVIHTGGAIGTAYNPTDSLLNVFVDFVSQSYNATWRYYPDTAHGAVRTHIRFVLAKTDMNCNSTTGIERVDASGIPNYATDGIDFFSGKGAPISSITSLSPPWNPHQYLNAWLVTGINYAGGFALFPDHSTKVNGGLIVIDVAAARIDVANVMTHELGHALGLYHTFEGGGTSTCPPSGPCATTGDFICDTEPTIRDYNCIDTFNSCTGMAYVGGNYNYMSYSNCICNRFSKGQRDVMLYSLHTYYDDLIHSLAGQAPYSFPLVPAQCLPIGVFHKTPYPYPSTSVAFNTIIHKSGWRYGSDSLAYHDNSCLYRTELTAGNSYPLTISTDTGQEVKVYIDYNNDGAFNPLTECIYADTGIASRLKTVHTGIVNIPYAAVGTLPLRMRVVSDVGGGSGLGPCTSISSGFVGDYAVTILGATSISKTVAPKVVVVPNPANSILNIDFDQPIQGTIRLFNNYGQVLWSTAVRGREQLSMDVSEYPTGLYYLLVVDAIGSPALVKVNIIH